MPKVSIKKQTSTPAADAYNKVKGMLSDDKDLKKLDPSYKCTFNDSGLTGSASGKMFKADMTIKNQGAGCEVEIIVDLPLALSLVKGMVQKTLQKKLDDSLA
jgi:hypothetical protein